MVDLGGLSIRVTSPIELSEPITVRNGSVAADDCNVFTVTAPDVNLVDMNVSRLACTFAPTTADGSMVAVTGRSFRSTNTNYSGAGRNCIYLTHAACNETVIDGGSFATTLRFQDAAAVASGAGPTGSSGITVRNITVTEGVHGIALYDVSDSLVEGCDVSGCAMLPVVELTAWSDQGGGVYRCADRSDGVTRTLFVDGVQVSESLTPTTTPASDRWSQDSGFVYLNIGADPSTVTVTSKIVSGYGIMVYRQGVDTSRNVIRGNTIHDVDGIGIYLQLGTETSADNATDSNILTNVCTEGSQTGSLPFGGIGIAGGTGTVIHGDTITSVGKAGEGVVAGVNSYIGAVPTTSDGAVSDVTIDGVFGAGFRTQSTDWTFTNCSAVNTTGPEFVTP